jgi:hypothetical protein
VLYDELPEVLDVDLPEALVNALLCHVVVVKSFLKSLYLILKKTRKYFLSMFAFSDFFNVTLKP